LLLLLSSSSFDTVGRFVADWAGAGRRFATFGDAKDSTGCGDGEEDFFETLPAPGDAEEAGGDGEGRKN
jgi:hypothetical protein